MGATISRLNTKALSALALSITLALYRLKETGKLHMAYIVIGGFLREAYTSIRKNPMMESNVYGGVITYLISTVTWSVRYCVQEAKSMLWCSITIRNDDENYNSIVDYISEFCETDKSNQMATTKKLKFDRKRWRNRWNGITEKTAPEMELRPTRNVMMSFIYKGHRIGLYRWKGETITTGYDRRPLTMETLTLTCFGRDNGILQDIIQEALEKKLQMSDGDINIYVLSSGWMGGWEMAMSKKGREKDTVVLDANISDELLHDARTFLQSQKWYNDRGIPYRRGYLLYGPPGCGKTSFTQVIAGELRQDMCMLSLSDKNLNDSRLATNLREAPMNSIILLEDVDAVFVERTVQKEAQASVTFSGLLNAIDGVASQEGRMLFMTTNHIERLDPALIRPGRCDVRVEIKKASSMQMKQLFLRFFPGDEKNADLFAAKLPKFELSMAQLQGHLLENRANSKLAIERIPKLLQSTKPQKTDRMTIFEHLRRVGLEQYTAYFEHHGYRYRDEIEGLDDKRVKEWVFELRYEPLVLHKFKRLLSGDKDFSMQHYQLAELSTIREAFIAAFPVEHMVTHGEAPPKLRRLSSHERHGMVVRKDTDVSISDNSENAEGKDQKLPPLFKPHYHVMAREVEELSKKLCERLSKNGKGMVSVYQLHYLFSIFYNPREVVENAEILTRPRTSDSKRIKEMTTFEFLKRCNMHEASVYFENNEGMRLARDLLKAEKGHGPIPVPSFKKELFLRILKCDTNKDANMLAGMQMLDRRRVVNLFLNWYPKDFEMAFEFASSITDDMGRGLASAMQIEAHLKKYKDNIEETVKNARKELVDVKKQPMKPPPKVVPRKFWVRQWLMQIGLPHLAEKFIAQGMCHYDDVVTNPVITDEQLDKVVQVKKLGERRKIQRAIQAILDGGDDGLKYVYRGNAKSKAMFKLARVFDESVAWLEAKEKEAKKP